MSISFKDDVSEDVRNFKNKSNEPTQNLKVVAIGNTGVGKTSLLNAGFHPLVSWEGKKLFMGTWDTSGGSEYDRLRPLSYPETNVFIVCFDLSDQFSLESVLNKWYPELQMHCPSIPIILCGCKSDLKKDITVHCELKSCNSRFCRNLEIVEVAKAIKAYSFVECSAKTGKNVKEVFDDCCKVFFSPNKTEKKGIFRKKKKIPSFVGGSNWVELEKKYKKEEKIRFKEIKKQILNESVKSKKEYQKYYQYLSRDVILHILHEFYLVDYSYLREFQFKFVILFNELNLSSERIINHFFGYFKYDKKRIIKQYFYNFKIYGKKYIFFVPAFRKTLFIDVGRNLTTSFYYENYFCKNKKEILIKKLYNVGFKDLRKSLNLCSSCVDLSIYEESNYNCNNFAVELMNCPKLNNLEIYFLQRIGRYSFGDLNLPNLKRLVLDKILVKDITFKYLCNLEYLKISDNDNPLLEHQYKGIIQIKSLKCLFLYKLSLLEIESQLFKIFDHKGIEKLLFNECTFDVGVLKDVFINLDSKLEFLGIRFSFSMVKPPIISFQKFPPRFLEMIKNFKKNKKKQHKEFKYELISKDEKESTEIDRLIEMLNLKK